MLGEQNGALVHMMRNLEIERLTLAAMSLGIALRCCDVMTQYAATERKAFGSHLTEFGQIQRPHFRVLRTDSGGPCPGLHHCLAGRSRSPRKPRRCFF